MQKHDAAPQVRPEKIAALLHGLSAMRACSWLVELCHDAPYAAACVAAARSKTWRSSCSMNRRNPPSCAMRRSMSWQAWMTVEWSRPNAAATTGKLTALILRTRYMASWRWKARCWLRARLLSWSASICSALAICSISRAGRLAASLRRAAS